MALSWDWCSEADIWSAISARWPRTAQTSADFALLWQVRDLLSAKFIGDQPASQAQVYGAANGLAASYKDPYTVFVEPAPRRFERDEIRGHFGGIGARMGRNEAGELVLTVMREQTGRTSRHSGW